MALNESNSNVTTRLGDLLELVIDHRGKTPKKLGGDFIESGVPVISAIHIKGGRIAWEERERFVSREMFERWMKDPLKKGDVLLTSEAPLGEVAMVQSDDDLVLSQRLFALRPKKDRLDARYLMYYLQSDLGQRELIGRASGSTVVGIKQAELVKIAVPNQPLWQQRVIGQVLGNLDAKIALNRKLSATLESIAKAVFKSWFIDFDPVKVKLAGEASVGMDAETAALFPDSMEESERGEIPLGWELRSLAEVVSVTKGRSYKSSELEESSVSLVTLKSFFRGGGYREDGLKPFTGTFKDDQVVEPGELVMAFTDVTQAAELIGVPAVVQADPSADLLVASLDVGIVRPRSSSVPKPFVYFHLKSDSFRNHAKSHASGTTVLHLSNDAVPNFKVVMPPAELLQKFREISEPVFSLIDKLSLESRLLSETRESLLPRLISGELQIPDEMLAA